ncbi:MAG: hypothetical protein U5K38_16480 [Woeseiaceae bacterium]|nr:hypothetical protein [Woeseiaceae bacterium]
MRKFPHAGGEVEQCVFESALDGGGEILINALVVRPAPGAGKLLRDRVEEYETPVADREELVRLEPWCAVRGQPHDLAGIHRVAEDL